jgi:hypothetical protein
MDPSAAVPAIAHLIQLAVAPVFLLAGIGSILNVLAQRLARVVDRARRLETELDSLDAGEREVGAAELGLLSSRMNVVNLAIVCCTASALFVCVVVAILFVADLSDFPFGRPIAWLFIAAMLLLISGLVLFLWEIHLAMRSLRVRRRLREHGSIGPN